MQPGATHYSTVSGCPLQRDCDPLLHIDLYWKSIMKGGMLMITIESLIAVISLVLTAFGLGYAIGSKDTQK